jgi:hypothetical protein
MATRTKNNKDYIVVSPRPKIITTVSTNSAPPRCNTCQCIYSLSYIDDGKCEDCNKGSKYVQYITDEHDYSIAELKEQLETTSEYGNDYEAKFEVLEIEYNKLCTVISNLKIAAENHLDYQDYNDSPEKYSIIDNNINKIVDTLYKLNIKDVDDIISIR